MMKPKEWWIDDYNGNAYVTETADCIHVINKSAYDKAIAALKKYAAEFEFPDDAPGAWLAKKILKELGEQE